MNQKNPALQLLGIAKLSGNIKSGEAMVLEAVRDQSAELVILANDASDGTKKKFTDKCTYYEIPVRMAFSKESLAHAIGRDFVAMVAITEGGLAGKMLSLLDSENV